eukprot:scaffold21835_cov18-Tisochrysis_lutea.AAC.1
MELFKELTDVSQEGQKQHPHSDACLGSLAHNWPHSWLFATAIWSMMMTQKETLQSTLQSSRAGCGCNACLIHAYLNACFVQGVRRLGAAAVDLCHVALGVVDATWEYQLKPWDVTGGCVILLEAGGKLTTMDGQPY